MAVATTLVVVGAAACWIVRVGLFIELRASVSARGEGFARVELDSGWEVTSANEFFVGWLATWGLAAVFRWTELSATAALGEEVGLGASAACSAKALAAAAIWIDWRTLRVADGALVAVCDGGDASASCRVAG